MNMLVGIIGAIIAFASVLSILFYILYGISYYSLAKNRGYNKPWLAWIPVASDYLKGAIADDINRRQGKKSNFRIWLMVLSIVALFSGVIIGIVYSMLMFTSAFANGGFKSFSNFNGFVPFAGGFINSPKLSHLFQVMPLFSLLLNAISIAYAVIRYIVLYKTYTDYAPQNATLYLVLSIVINITEPFFLLSIKNKPSISIYGGQGYQTSGQPAAQNTWVPPVAQPYDYTQQPQYTQPTAPQNFVPQVPTPPTEQWNVQQQNVQPPQTESDKPNDGENS